MLVVAMFIARLAIIWRRRPLRLPVHRDVQLPSRVDLVERLDHPDIAAFPIQREPDTADHRLCRERGALGKRFEDALRLFGVALGQQYDLSAHAADGTQPEQPRTAQTSMSW